MTETKDLAGNYMPPLQRQLVDRLMNGDHNGCLYKIAQDLVGETKARRFVSEMTSRPETAALARAYVAARLTEAAFEAVTTFTLVLRGEVKLTQQQWQAVNTVIDKVCKDDGPASRDDKPLEQMNPAELQAFIEAKQAEKRKLELQASKAESLKADQAQPIERVAEPEVIDLLD